MKYAVIAISGTQFKVEEGQTISVDLQENDKKFSVDSVMLIVDDNKVIVGKPNVKDASVSYETIKNYQGKKLRIFKYKAKSRYRRTQGFRPQLTDIKITKISF